MMFFVFRIELLVDWRVTGNQREMIEKEIMGTLGNNFFHYMLSTSK